MTAPQMIYREIHGTICNVLKVGPDNIALDKAGGEDADFETNFESLANDLEAGRWQGADEARRCGALIRDLRVMPYETSTSKTRHAAHEELGELCRWFSDKLDATQLN